MRILDEQGNELTLDQCDLTVGFLAEETVIRPEAAPVDDVTKFAWAEEDYETIQRYVALSEKSWLRSVSPSSRSCCGTPITPSLKLPRGRQRRRTMLRSSPSARHGETRSTNWRIKYDCRCK